MMRRVDKEEEGGAQKQQSRGPWQDLFDGRNPAACFARKELLPGNGVDAQPAGAFLKLTCADGADFAQACTRDDFAAPLHIRAVAMTDSTNLRLYFAGHRVIFNWEGNPGELRIVLPAKPGGFGIQGKGRIPARAWVQVDWWFEEDQMRVLVNGEERASIPGDFSRARGLVGIGPYASTVTLKELVVAGPKAPRQPTPPAKTMALLETRNPAKAIQDGVLVEQGGMHAQPAALGLSLPGPKKGDHMRLVTKEEFAVPLRIRAVAMTDSTNLRLYFAGNRLIFNWEANPKELRVHWPPADHGAAVPGAGSIPTNEWVEIVWDLEPHWATIAVNGKVRALVPGQFAGFRGQVGIGPAEGSTVALRELSISGPSRKDAAE